MPDTASATLVRLDTLPLHHGGALAPCGVAYELAGDPARPLVVALGGISADRHVVAGEVDGAPGWWGGIVGPGLAVDTGRFAVLGIDWLGGRGTSTLPPADRLLDTRDQARALRAVLDHLGVARAHAVVGASYGGMVALAFGALFPTGAERLVVIGAAHESHAMATAVRAVQRKIVRLGVETGRAADAMRIARELAMTTYRTPTEFAGRFAGPPELVDGRPRFPVESYLEHHGRRFAREFTAQGFLLLSESLDLHRVDPADVRTPATIVAVAEDTLVPPWQVRAMAGGLGGPARLVELHSPYGHDAFLRPAPDFAAAVAAGLA